ncbi:MAG: biliverdin-producing heme oxygenase [Burkholderiaceae bacterium]|nr:biliverdin-producing heme oxygenase [Burkholderiaceae bacterium]
MSESAADPQASAGTTDLAQKLKLATAPLHRQVERSGLMRRLLAGDFVPTDYVALLHDLAALYGALEAALARHGSHPWLAVVIDRALFRADALRRDLHALQPAAQVALSPAAAAYVVRLQWLDQHDAGLLLAHAYVRYLGDLSGGQVVQRIVARTLGLTPPTGLRFYDFGGMPAVAARAEAFRHSLAALRLDADAVQALTVEAQWSFAQHAQMFIELDRR